MVVRQDFNGGYIKANQASYDLFVMDTYLHTKKITPKDDGYYYIEKDIVRWIADTAFDTLINFKQFYINNNALSWDEPKRLGFNKLKCSSCGEFYDISKSHNCFKQDEPTQINNMEDNGLSTIGEEDETNIRNEKRLERPMDSISNETISITDKNGTVYEYENPKFECELLKVIFDHNDKAYIIGYSLDVRKELGYPYPKTWTGDGKCYDDNDILDGEFNLTPIQKPWYEDEANFPALVVNGRESFVLIYDIEEFEEYDKSDFRLATKTEINNIYCNKE